MNGLIFPFLEKESNLNPNRLNEIGICVIERFALNRDSLIDQLISVIGPKNILDHIGHIPIDLKNYNPLTPAPKVEVEFLFPNSLPGIDDPVIQSKQFSSKLPHAISFPEWSDSRLNGLGKFNLSRIYLWGTPVQQSDPMIQVLPEIDLQSKKTLFPFGEYDSKERIKHYVKTLIFRIIIGDSLSHADLVARLSVERLNHYDFRLTQGIEFLYPPNEFFKEFKNDQTYREVIEYDHDGLKGDPDWISFLKDRLLDFFQSCENNSVEKSADWGSIQIQRTVQKDEKKPIHPALIAASIIAILMLLRGR